MIFSPRFSPLAKDNNEQSQSVWKKLEYLRVFSQFQNLLEGIGVTFDEVKKLLEEEDSISEAWDIKNNKKGLEKVRVAQAIASFRGVKRNMEGKMSTALQQIDIPDFSLERIQGNLQFLVEQVEAGYFTPEEALLLIDAEDMEHLLYKQIPTEEKKDATILSKGISGSPGAATGQIVFSSQKAKELGDQGQNVILICPHTTAADDEGIQKSKGVITTTGGKTSHAAIIARQSGIPSLVNAQEITFSGNTVTIGEKTFHERDSLTLSASTGELFDGELSLEEPDQKSLKTVLEWTEEYSKLQVYTNAERREHIDTANKWGARGIGVARTEHTCLGKRLPLFQKAMLEIELQGKREALNEWGEQQKQDYLEIFRSMRGRPVSIRLLDPPMHEFFPKLSDDDALQKISGFMEMDLDLIRQHIASLQESNPMMGLRGVRLLIKYPKIAEVQIRAIADAFSEVAGEDLGLSPQILNPLLTQNVEVPLMKAIIERALSEGKYDVLRDRITFGAMIEAPSACSPDMAESFARMSDGFSFGSNDLTQATLGQSRDDLAGYPETLRRQARELGIPLEEDKDDPFVTLHPAVIFFMQQAIENGRKGNPNLKVGICGEHGGDPRSIEQCFLMNMNYVSVSPLRIPTARIAAAQSQILFSSEEI